MGKPGVLQKKDCWICHNSENSTNLTVLNSEKILKICRSYLNPSVIIESLKNETPVSCCNYCFETAVELTLLEKQIDRLGKEISELSSLFLKSVVDQRNERGSKVLLSNSQVQEPTGTGGRVNVNDLGIDESDDGNIIHSDSEEEIEVKHSYEETFSKVIDTADPQIAPNQQMPTKKVQKEDHQQTVKASMGDLLKCFKMPNILLERHQTCKSRKPKIVVDETLSNINLEINHFENSARLNTGDNYRANENIFSFDATVLSKNPEKATLSLSESVIVGKETVKCEEDVEENQPYKCSICGQGFFKLCDLEDHEKLHINVTQYSCSICGKSFLDPSRLKLHEMLHTAKRPFKSSSTLKSITTSSRNLKSHVIFPSRDKPFKCSVCSKSFSCDDNLHSHKLLHSQNRRFKCSFCPKLCRSKQGLKNHEISHTGEISFKCSICPKSFTNSGGLKSHMVTHSKKRPFKCSFCPKSFLSARDLRNHVTGVHAGEGPFKCSACSKSFGSVCHLKRHEIVHTDERPFSCSICQKTFKSQEHVNKHCSQVHRKNKEIFILP